MDEEVKFTGLLTRNARGHFLPEETYTFTSREKMQNWKRRRLGRCDTEELHILDSDGDLIYYYSMSQCIEEMYRKDGSVTKYTCWMGL